MKVPGEPILITENEGEIFFRALRGMIGAKRLYLVAFSSVTPLIYQPPHPWGASDGPEYTGGLSMQDITCNGNQKPDCNSLMPYGIITFHIPASIRDYHHMLHMDC